MPLFTAPFLQHERMSIVKVKEYLRRFGYEDRIIEPEEPTPTVESAAKALGTAPQNIAKSLAVALKDRDIIIVTAGDVKLDNAAFKGCFHEKAHMLPREITSERIGHAPGGVCPFALNDGVKVYLDESLKGFRTVYPAAGNDHSGVRLTPDELFELSGAEGWVRVTKPKEDERLSSDGKRA